MNTTDTAVEQALMRLEQTRTRLVVRCSQTLDPAPACDDLPGASSGLSPFAGIITEWLSKALLERLGAPSHEQPGIVASITEGIQPALDQWIKSHPWLSVGAGLAAGGLAVTQHRRILKWALVSAIPWLTTQLGAVALPLIVQWLARKSAAEHTTTTTDAAAEAPTA